jgi:spore coat polysaccharide biosynthesis protein SpsF
MKEIPQNLNNPIRTIAIIQARMSSSRLPGKVLRPIAGQPMLVWCVERTRLAHKLDNVVVATTTDPSDDPLAGLCAERGYPCSRGSLYDVLDRYYQAAQAFRAEIIVRITSDCPLIDPGLIDDLVNRFTDSGSSTAPLYDFAANRLPPPWGRTYPIGLDLELCTFQGLGTAWVEAQEKHQREHVMPFFYENPERFRILHVNHSVDYGAMRWTVDTPEDLELLNQIAAHFPGRMDFSWLEVVDLFQRHPELADINAQVQHKYYRQIDERSSQR